MKAPESLWPRFLITAALMLLVVWGLILVTDNLATGIVKDENGHIVDAYQRATDVLNTVLPLLTIALGYWFGAAGKEKAEQKAAAAQEQATTAQRQLGLVLGKSDDPDLLQKARQAYPEAFGAADESTRPPSG